MSRGTRVGIAFVVLGIFIPLLGLCLAVGDVDGAGNLLADFRVMYIPLRRKQEIPIFGVPTEKRRNSDATVVRYGDTGLMLEFSAEVPETEIERAIGARFPSGRLLPSDPQSGRLRLVEWSTVREALVLPLRYLVAAGLLLVLVGTLVMIFRVPSPADHRNA